MAYFVHIFCIEYSNNRKEKIYSDIQDSALWCRIFWYLGRPLTEYLDCAGSRLCWSKSSHQEETRSGSDPRKEPGSDVTKLSLFSFDIKVNIVYVSSGKFKAGWQNTENLGDSAFPEGPRFNIALPLIEPFAAATACEHEPNRVLLPHVTLEVA